MRYLRFSFFLSIFFCFFSCEKNEEAKKPTVIVSIAPYEYFVEKIGGDFLTIRTIAPEGVNSHTYEPTPRSIASLEKADIWFQIGEGFEKKLTKVLKEKNPKLLIVNLQENLPLIHDAHSCSHHGHSHENCSHSVDIHTWMSPKLALMQCEKIKSVVKNHYEIPHIDSRYESLENELTLLDEDLHALLKNLPSRSFLTSHPSFAYFCEEYQLEQISVEISGKAPLAREVKTLLDQAQEDFVKVAIAQPQFSAKGLNLIAKKLQIPVKMVDPYTKKYPESLTHLAKILKAPKGT